MRMETKRFHIEDNGIWDKYRGGKKLNWLELCNTLNGLDCIADKNLDEYEYICRLEEQVSVLEKKLRDVKRVVERCYNDLGEVLDE